MMDDTSKGITSFARGEWELLADAALAASAAIALSEPGGGRREADAVLRGWHEAPDLYSDSDLIQALVRAFDPATRTGSTRPPPSGQPTFDDVVDEAVNLCRQAIELLSTRGTPEDVEDYQHFVLFVARRVADASTEGGFLGLGGEPVSRTERAVLHQIADALGYKR
jgi:hypothetical protein